MRKGLSFYLFSAGAALLCAVSCSIKEDRELCPADLVMDYSLVRADERTGFRSEEDSLLVEVQTFYREIIRPADYPSLHRISVKRTAVNVGCHYGFTRSRLQNGEGRLVIPLGEDSDRLYSFRQTVVFDPSTEESYVMPSLGNEFTKVILSFPEKGWEAYRDKYSIRAIGNTCGIDLRSGRPLSGPFTCELRPYDSHSYCFNMPRQNDRDISIAVVSRDSGEKVFDIDLAAELDNVGYLWNAQSLSPLVVINVDMVDFTLDVNVLDWDDVVYFNYEI